MSVIEIVKLKLTKLKEGEGLEVDYNIFSDNGKKTPCWQSPPVLIHPDLKAALNTLTIHLALIADQIDITQIKDIKNIPETLTEKFYIHGYSIGGDDDDQGFQIYGHRILRSGKAFNYTTPFTRFEENEATAYKFVEHVEECIETIANEVKKYLSGEKQGESVQGDLFKQDKVTNMKIAEPVTTPQGIVKQIVDETNNGKEETQEQLDARIQQEINDGIRNKQGVLKKNHRSLRKVPQSADHKSGTVEE